jgi:lysophospholipase L1-like esterase
LADSLHLRTFAVLRAIRFTQQQQEQTRDQFFDTALYSPDFPANLPQVWATEQKLLREFAAAVQANGSRFGLVVIPNWRVVEPEGLENLPADINPASIDLDRLHQVIDEDAQAAGTPILDLKPLAEAHYKQPNPEPLYWEKDGHFNVTGYRLMGEAICHWIIAEGLLNG